MEYDLILARSVTYAQRMQSALNRIGIRSQIFRAPRDLTDLGCAYLVRISPNDLSGQCGHNLPKAAHRSPGNDGSAFHHELAGAGRTSTGHAGGRYGVSVPLGAGGAI